MELRRRKTEGRIFVIVLILFLLEIITFPIVVYFTYADRSESPCHTITYEDHKLSWDKSTSVDAEGTAKLDLFDGRYENAVSDDGSNIVAPGTEMNPILRLINGENEKLIYTAVLYKIKAEDIPVEVSVSGTGFTDTEEYMLPSGVNRECVIKAVTGEVEPYKLQDFDLHWKWDFEKDDHQNMTDTEAGNRAAENTADEVTLGFYIVVQSENGDISYPETGDGSLITGYTVLIVISAVMLALLIIDERRREDE